MGFNSGFKGLITFYSNITVLPTFKYTERIKWDTVTKIQRCTAFSVYRDVWTTNK